MARQIACASYGYGGLSFLKQKYIDHVSQPQNTLTIEERLHGLDRSCVRSTLSRFVQEINQRPRAA